MHTFTWGRFKFPIIIKYAPNLVYQISLECPKRSKTILGNYSITCVKRPLSKRPQIGFQDQLSLNAGQKYCRMLQREHFAILLTFIKPPFVIKIFVLSIFKWPFYKGLLYSFLFLNLHVNGVVLGLNGIFNNFPVISVVSQQSDILRSWAGSVLT